VVARSPMRDVGACTTHGSLMNTAWRSHLTFIGLLAAALLFRAPYLDAIPNPCADEGNWTWIPYDILLGRPTTLPPDARFVPMTFATMIRWSFAHFGPTFAAARGVLVAGIVVGMTLAYAALRALGATRGALVVAGVMAVHPWAVWWSRTVSVPYALAFACGVVGPIAFLLAWAQRRLFAQVALLVLSAQVMFIGMHFSPLALLPVGACGVWLLAQRDGRRQLTRPWVWLAFALGSIHAVPIVRGIFEVAARGNTRPNYQFTHFAMRLNVYFRTVFGGLGGEATVRHFTGTEYPLVVEWLVAIACLSVLGLAIARARVASRETAVPNPAATPDVTRDVSATLYRFGLLYALVALIGAPVLLAPARPWNLPAIDAERYLFAVLAPFAIVLAGLAEDRARRVRWLAIAFVAYTIIPTVRIAHGLFAGGAADRGIYTLRGGGAYRGWRAPREHTAVAWLIRHEVLSHARGQAATILVADYAFHPIHFVNALSGVPTTDVTKFPAPRRPGGHFYFVLWSEGLFAPEFHPTREAEANRALRRRMHQDFEHVQLLRRFAQPNGWPLFEIWTGVQPAFVP